jgi:hypothetical protein
MRSGLWDPVNLSCWPGGPGRAGTRRRPALNLPQAVRGTSEAWLEGKVPSLVASSLPTPQSTAHAQNART